MQGQLSVVEITFFNLFGFWGVFLVCFVLFWFFGGWGPYMVLDPLSIISIVFTI